MPLFPFQRFAAPVQVLFLLAESLFQTLDIGPALFVLCLGGVAQSQGLILGLKQDLFLLCLGFQDEFLRRRLG